MSDDTTTEEKVAATTPPVGVSSTQIFTIALMVLAFYGLTGAAIVIGNSSAAERTAFMQATIQLATVAVGFYLGSSASSRNKDRV